MMRRPSLTPAIVLIGCLLATAGTFAQRRYGGLPGASKAFNVNGKYDGRFRFVRLMTDCADVWRTPCRYYLGLPPWEHGYPLSEQNLMQIMSSVTALDPHVEDSMVLAIQDPELSKYPVAYMTEAGFWTINDAEATALNAYLVKGGFVIFDDFRDPSRGGGGWGNFESNMARVIPGAEWMPLTSSDPIFHSFFEINDLSTLKQHYNETTPPQFYGLYEKNDRSRRLMAIANYNVDISDWWEFSGQGYSPVDATNQAYKFGVNYVVYGMTH